MPGIMYSYSVIRLWIIYVHLYNTVRIDVLRLPALLGGIRDGKSLNN